MIAALLRKRGRPIGIRIGGFNLLPYRQAIARGRRRRFFLEALGATALGAMGALAWTASDAYMRAGLLERRAALESALAGLAAPLAEYRRLQRMSAQVKEDIELAAALAWPRERFAGVVAALSRAPLGGVVLQRLGLTEAGLELDASASDSGALTAWIERLARVRGVAAASIVDWRPAANGAPHGASVVARLQWQDVQSASAVPDRANGADNTVNRRIWR
jgi:Tfp pilus assembly protein PilN